MEGAPERNGEEVSTFPKALGYINHFIKYISEGLKIHVLKKKVIFVNNIL